MNQALCFAPPSVFAFALAKVSSGECRDLLASAETVYWPGFAEYLRYFFMTCLLEAPAYYFIIGKNLPAAKKLAAIVGLNLATHPLAVYFFPVIGTRFAWSGGTTMFTTEIFAPLVEALLLIFVFKIAPLRSTVASILANLTSWWLGLLILAAMGVI